MPTRNSQPLSYFLAYRLYISQVITHENWPLPATPNLTSLWFPMLHFENFTWVSSSSSNVVSNLYLILSLRDHENPKHPFYFREGCIIIRALDCSSDNSLAPQKLLEREFGVFRHTVHLYLTDVCPGSSEIWRRWWTSRTTGMDDDDDDGP